MVDYINNLITALSTLTAIFLTYFLIHYPSKRKKKKEERSEQLLQIKTLMDSVFKIFETKDKNLKVMHLRKVVLECEYIDKNLRMYVNIPLPKLDEESDKLDFFLESSIKVAKDFVTKNKTSNKQFSIWMSNYRLLNMLISGRVKD